MKSIVPNMLVASTLLHTATVSANAVWPGLVIAVTFYHAKHLILISVIIEAMFFYLLIPSISVTKALVISSIGNTASFIVGTMIGIITSRAYLTLILTLFEPWIANTKNYPYIPYIWAASDFVGLLLISIVVELVTLKLIFDYNKKKLLIPVMIGNIITYTLIPGYTYFFKPLTFA